MWSRALGEFRVIRCSRDWELIEQNHASVAFSPRTPKRPWLALGRRVLPVEHREGTLLREPSLLCCSPQQQFTRAHVFAHSQTLMCKCIPANVQHLSTGDHEAPRPMGSQKVRGVAPPACWRPREVKAPWRREVSPPRSRSRASQAVRGVGEGTARRLVSGWHCGGLTLREDGPRGRGGGRGSGEQAAVAEGCARLCKQLALHPGRHVFIGAQLLTTRVKHSF